MRGIISRKTLTVAVMAVFVCAIVVSAGVQARDQDPVGLTPTPEDAASMGKRP